MDFNELRAEIAKIDSRNDLREFAKAYRAAHKMTMHQDAAFKAIISQRDSRILAKQWGFGKEQHE